MSSYDRKRDLPGWPDPVVPYAGPRTAAGLSLWQRLRILDVNPAAEVAITSADISRIEEEAARMLVPVIDRARLARAVHVGCGERSGPHYAVDGPDEFDYELADAYIARYDADDAPGRPQGAGVAPAADCGAVHPVHPATRCRRKPGHGGAHATARYDVQWEAS